MSDDLTRKQKQQLQRREDILDAAEIVLALKGFHSVTVDDIAEKAEYSVGTIYNMFKSKDHLYHQLLSSRFEVFLGEMLSAVENADGPIDAVKAYIESKIDICQRNPYFLKLYVRERLGDRFVNNELWSEDVEPFCNKLYEVLQEKFKQGIQQGVFVSGIDPADMVVAVEGVTDGFMYRGEMLDDGEYFSQKKKVIMDLFFNRIVL